MKGSKKYRVLMLVWTGMLGITQAQISYQVSFPNPNSHYIHVDASISAVKGDSLDMKMPVWIPGSYMVREFSRHVEGFTAYDKNGTPLKSVKVRKNAWRIYTRGVNEIRVSYRVYAFELSVRTNYVDVDQAYINGAALFMYADPFMQLPYEIHFKPDSRWNRISTGLPITGKDPWIRTAENYDRLADSPVVMGNHDTINFVYQGIPHEIALVGEANYDREKIKSDFYKIVDQCTKIFGENPNKHYTFIIHNTLSGGGGLEHLNSCSIMTARTTYEDADSYRGLLSLVAHEYFHLWIVKRVRPLELGPFDYENEVYTRQLWFYEGFTSFFDDYLVYRSGLSTEADYLETVLNNVQALSITPGNKIQPVSEGSFDAWIKYYRQNENSRNSIISYYTKGAVLATILNLDILNRTGGKISLDSLMHFLYHEKYKRTGKGLTDDQLMEVFNKVGGHNYVDFFNKYIHGTEELPLENYFNMAGLNLKRVDGMKQMPGYLGAVINKTGNKAVITRVDRDSPAWNEGLSVNDEITAVNDQPADKITGYLETTQPGTVVKFKILRMGLPKDVTVTLGEPVIKEFVFEDIPKATKTQRMVRKRWLNQ